MPVEHEPDFNEESLKHGISFHFDPERMLFVVNNALIFEPSKQRGFYAEMMDAKYSLPKHERVIQPDDGLKYIPFGPIVQLPYLRERLSKIYLNNKETQDIEEQTTYVMRQVYQKLNPNIELPEDDKYSFISFRARIDQDGSFRLNTFGDCACLNPEYDPLFDYREDPKRLVNYDLHNIDSDTQITSIMAGAGTIAWMVKRRI